MNQVEFNFPERKKKYINRYCKIVSTASFLPEKSLHNDDIIGQYRLTFKSAAMIKAMGVETRRIAENTMTDSDLLKESASRCLNKYGIKPDDLSRLIVNKYFGDNLMPMTASQLQKKLGSRTAVHAFDIDGGISSFLYSVDAASRFIHTGDAYILLSSGGIHNRLVSKTDPRVAFLFGDASASLLFGVSSEQHILASYFYSNFQYYDLATAISPLSIVDMNACSLMKNGNSVLFDTYQMGNWKIAEEFYRQASTVVAHHLLEEAGLSMDDMDVVLVTENNRRIWELTLETLGVDESRSISILRQYGNTMSAMLPLLLDIGFTTQRIQQGMKIMMISHGEGMSGGGLIYKV